MDFGERLRQLRKEKGISQEKLAEKMNVSRQAISKWERGATMLDIENIVQLSKLFQVPVDSLLLDVGNEVSGTRKDIGQKEKTIVPTILCIVGILCEMMSVCFAYLVQYYDMKINGSCFANAVEYLLHFPVILLVIAGGICLCIGGSMIIKKMGNKKAS